MSGPELLVTGFTVGKVRAELVGARWLFSWFGKNRDDAASYACSLEDAQVMAAALHEMLTDLEPLLREVERRRGDITQMLVRWQQDRQEAEGAA